MAMIQPNTVYGLTRGLHPLHAAAPYYPMWYALWVKPTGTLGTRYFFSLTTSADDTNYIALRTTSGGAFVFTHSNAGVLANSSISAAVIGQWTFLFIQNIAVNKRIIEGINFSNGEYLSDTSSTSVTPLATVFNRFNIGSKYGATIVGAGVGATAEFYYGTGDIAGGKALGKSRMWKLAMRGPFLDLAFRKTMLEYRSLRSRLRTLDPQTDFYRGGGDPTFSLSGPIVGPHVPYLSRYERLTDCRRPMIY